MVPGGAASKTFAVSRSSGTKQIRACYPNALYNYTTGEWTMGVCFVILIMFLELEIFSMLTGNVAGFFLALKTANKFLDLEKISNSNSG